MRPFKPVNVVFCLLLAAGLCLAVRQAGQKSDRGLGEPAPVRHERHAAQEVPAWSDSFGDGFPDGARLDGAEDRESFTRWLVFLAEAEYYRPSPQAAGEIQDCAALVRFAFRNALVAHTAAWRRSVRLGGPYEPGFGDVKKFTYPHWPLGRGLFRTGDGTFTEFADSAALLHYNTFRVSQDFRAARAGDLLFFYHPAGRQPYHAMLFVGRSYFQSNGSDWIVYHTGDVGAGRGEIRELDQSVLMQHPDPSWRPLLANPHFLGVYRFEILR